MLADTTVDTTDNPLDVEKADGERTLTNALGSETVRLLERHFIRRAEGGGGRRWRRSTRERRSGVGASGAQHDRPAFRSAFQLPPGLRLLRSGRAGARRAHGRALVLDCPAPSGNRGVHLHRPTSRPAASRISVAPERSAAGSRSCSAILRSAPTAAFTVAQTDR